MAKRYSFRKGVIEDFETKHNLKIPLTQSQRSKIENDESITFSQEQLSHLAELLTAEDNSRELLTSFYPHSSGVSMSLFVVNDAIWKLMEKKEEHQDRMLPMVTIPWFYWEETSRNKWGVSRIEPLGSYIQFDFKNGKISIVGNGGDFCGIIERKALKTRYSPWRIIIPEMPESSKRVPKYDKQTIAVNIEFGDTEADLFPSPDYDLDYTFSESPKVFYINGLVIRADGRNIKLKIGNRRESQLLGEVRIFIGSPMDEKEPLEILEFHVWLAAFHSLITAR